METKEHNHQHEHHTQMNHGGTNPPHDHMGDDHHSMMIEDFKKRFWISLIITIPVLILSQMIQMLFGFHLSFAGDKYILFILSSVIFFMGAGLF